MVRVDDSIQYIQQLLVRLACGNHININQINMTKEMAIKIDKESLFILMSCLLIARECMDAFNTLWNTHVLKQRNALQSIGMIAFKVNAAVVVIVFFGCKKEEKEKKKERK